MKSINLIFGCHSHQPVGNFDFVFQEAYDKAYKPFVDVLERYPAVHVTLHYTGPLWDWFLAHAPDYVARLRKLVAAGQVEIMGGGYYEPLLCAIPERDAIAQIQRMQAFCREHFGVEPKGMWLTERVWEPQMARILAKAGVEYTALDDMHFVCSGIGRDELFGYYMTEDEGRTLKVFPILERLRYQIPFHTVAETIEYLRELATEDGDRCAVVHDDGEKFGVWPYTFKSVYEEGWLEEFFQALTDNRDWLHALTYREFLDRSAPAGRTYITCASYKEMMAWALPTPMQRRLYEFESRLKENPEDYARYSPFVKGGFWRNFLAKYPEANGIQKRMLLVSNRIDRLREQGTPPETLEPAVRLLHEGQCNCAYWHGVFGGLYLNHLRTALYEKLIEADVRLDAIEGRSLPYRAEAKGDFDGDGEDEWRLENGKIALFFKPDDGGSLYELDYKPKPFNWTNTLARRDEPYHDRLREQAAAGHESAEGGGKSIHELGLIKEIGLDKLLIHDRYRRTCLREHFWAEMPTAEGLWANQAPVLASFAEIAFDAEVAPGRITLRGESGVSGLPESRISLCKTIELGLDESACTIAYDIAYAGSDALDVVFGVEFALNLLAGAAADRYYWSQDRPLGKPMLATRGRDEGMSHVAMRDDWQNLECGLFLAEPATVYRYPLETVSQSEGGLERVYQGSVLTPCWALRLEPGRRVRHSIVLAIDEPAQGTAS